MAPYAVIRPVMLSPRPRLALAALLCAAGMAAPFGMRAALAQDCAAGTGPTGAAGTSALYGELASTVSAEPLSVDIAAKAIGGSCTWVYEVKILTPSGSVALLDFDLVNLDLKHVEGSSDDPDIARLLDRVGGAGRRENDTDDSASGDVSGSDGAGGSGSDGGDSGGSGSDGSGSDGDGGSGSEGGGDSSGGDSDGGGGEGGSGGGDSGGGDSGGGDSGGGGEGGEGGGDD